MTELSLNILDLVQNSITAEATRIIIAVRESEKGGLMTIEIRDNGHGMSEDLLKRVTDPFYTTRTTRKVGLGIPLFKMAAEMSGGEFKINSSPNAGCEIKASFKLSHIDRPPLGNMKETMVSLIECNPDLDFRYERGTDIKSFALDTLDLRETLGGVGLNEPEVLSWISDYLDENEAALNS